jgi:hypothetical protein
MSRGVLFALSFWGTVAGSVPTSAAPALFPVTVLQDDDSSVKLEGVVRYFQDPTAATTWQEVREKPEVFKPFTDGKTTFPNTRDVFWLRYRIENPGEQPVSRILRFPFWGHSEIDLYQDQVGAAEPIHKRAGLHVPPSERDMLDRHHTFKLDFPAHATTDIYVRIHSWDRPILTSRLESVSFYAEFKSRDALYKGIYFGVLLALLFYNFFVFLVTRTHAYGAYTLFIAMTGLFLSATDGYLDLYFFMPHKWGGIAI